uniref:Uncharacterized protein n=1 Tax=Arundo donax TaxID=35708 RepID=A0A0A9ACC4_ARUDO
MLLDLCLGETWVCWVRHRTSQCRE